MVSARPSLPGHLSCRVSTTHLIRKVYTFEAQNKWPIPLILSRSPQFAYICLFYCLIYELSFVLRTSWRQNLLSLRLLGNCACFLCSFNRPKMVILLCLTIPIKCAMFLSNSNLPFLALSPRLPRLLFFPHQWRTTTLKMR